MTICTLFLPGIITQWPCLVTLFVLRAPRTNPNWCHTGIDIKSITSHHLAFSDPLLGTDHPPSLPFFILPPPETFNLPPAKMGRSPSTAVVAQPACQAPAPAVKTVQEKSGSPLPHNDAPGITENADSAAEDDGEDKSSTPLPTESDGCELSQTREELDADDAEETDDDEYDQHPPPHHPTHLCVPGMKRRRGNGWPRLSGPGFFLCPCDPSDAATTPTTDPAIPQLLLTTDEGEQFSLWDPVRYEYDFYHGRFHYYCLDTEDDEAAAEEEERPRAEYDRRCAEGQVVDGVGDDERTSTEGAGNVPDDAQVVLSPDSNRHEESRPCIVNGFW